MTWNYTIQLPDGTTRQAFDIAMAPFQYQAVLPAGWLISIAQPNDGGQQYPIYRLIIETSPGRVDTGATLPGCDMQHETLCDPRQFARTLDAYNYAIGRGEIPVIVDSTDAAWAIVDAENRARALMQQYVGPSQSPTPTATQGGATGGTGGTSDGSGITEWIAANPMLTVGIAYVAYRMLVKK